MLISYVVPSYNSSASIERCIKHLLDQKGDFDRQIIVVDDGSSDNSVELISKYPVNLYKRPHLGASATRNYGISMATGNFIALVDADTFLDLDWTQQCLQIDTSLYDILCTTDLSYHEENPAARLVMEQIRKNPYVTAQNMIGFIGNGTFIPSRCKNLIHYDEMYIVGGEDMDLMLSLIEKGCKIRYVLWPSFVHKHMHRSQVVKYLSYIKKRCVFAYGGLRTWFKHPQSDYARRDGMNNLWAMPLYPFIWIYKKVQILLK